MKHLSYLLNARQDSLIDKYLAKYLVKYVAKYLVKPNIWSNVWYNTCTGLDEIFNSWLLVAPENMRTCGLVWNWFLYGVSWVIDKTVDFEQPHSLVYNLIFDRVWNSRSLKSLCSWYGNLCKFGLIFAWPDQILDRILGQNDLGKDLD